ncbi:AAA family ATPase [Euhalothece natronophila Z-M001]|uniref:AAA family ATPase n=1 Tax=Euhalothece natronophila Z-M001 TaxID=522448 RepID=A0A5B8NIG3_9CHRO|nr:AAA family ATPase [Euhalothece natronophila]QDZ38737.1 AAA family ATPase [Euhalothece natronophila Z-M001]
MNKGLSGYTIQETIAQRTHTIIFRGIRETDQQPVIIKRLKADNPDLKQIQRLQHEYEVTKNLDDEGVVKSYSLEPDGNSLALILEDFGGQSLSEYLLGYELPLAEFFHLAIQLADILAQLHPLPLIHKDIKPSNIIINPETQQVKLTDFNLAIQAPFEYPSAQHPNTIMGTLAYISPEQTGRMNCYLDHRSDLYSLGVTFYEMLTGQLPFTSANPLELIHAHLAESPVPPHHHRSIPLALSHLILKMLAKKADEGYQTATGLKYDLERCWQQWEEQGEMETFELGTRDRASALIIPQKLYGREAEVQALLDTFTQVKAGNTTVFMISGYAGIGKTSIVQEVRPSLLEAQGHYLGGKFEQLKRDTPYLAITQAFQDVIRQLLTESEEKLSSWREQIQATLGNNGQVIIDLIPEVELLIGEQPSVPTLEGEAARNRFHQVFRDFVKGLCQQPLVLFLDDLQWADFASLELLQDLLSDDTIHSLLVIGAYRNNEVQATHPLIPTLDKIEAQPHLQFQEIIVTPLKQNQVRELISDTLKGKADVESLEQLNNLVVEKTQGNPFFINQFLKTLHEEELLTYSQQHDQWLWNFEVIQEVGLSDLNLVELLVRNLQKLPPPTIEILKIASCLGNQFTLEALAIITESSFSQIEKKLQIAIKKGFLIPNKEKNHDLTYQFLHDRIQQATYSLIPQEQKQLTHLDIGKKLLKETDLSLDDEKLFIIANQINCGQNLLTNRQEKDELAEINLKAGRKSNATTAYHLATYYLESAVNLLDEESWNRQYDLTLNIYLELAESYYLLANFAKAVSFISIGKDQAKTTLEQVKFIKIEIKINLAQSEFNLVLENGRYVLEKLGIDLVESPPKITNIEELKNLPIMNDPSLILAMEILNLIYAPACFSDSAIALPTLYTMLDLSRNYGNSLSTPYAYAVYGNIVAWMYLDIELGYQLGQLALEIVDQLQAPIISPQVNVAVYINLVYKKRHIEETINPLFNSIQKSLEFGNIEFACHNANFYCEHILAVGRNLTQVHKEQIKYINFIASAEQNHQLYLSKISTQTVANLIATPDLQVELTGKFFSEVEDSEYLIKIDNRILLFYVNYYKAFLYYLRREPEEAAYYCKTALNYSGFINAQFLFTEHNFFYSLALLGQYSYGSEEFSQEDQIQVTENQEVMQTWAYHAPMNFQYRYELVEAEKARVLGDTLQAMDLYDAAIAGAKENGFIQYVALANELAGAFYLELGRGKIAQTYLAEAHYAYRRWGANAKVKHLENQYLQFRLEQTIPQPKIKKDISIDSTTSSDTQDLDLMSIIKASQSLAAEIILDDLLGKLIQIVVENAGAQLGYLILEKEGQLYLEASAHSEEIHSYQSLPIQNSQQLPLSIINYVVRTKDNVILDEATTEELFSRDPYITKNQPQSVLCTPILNQGELLGLIYLENNLTSNAFTDDRLEIINILSSQAGISIKNAILYEEMKTLNTDLQATKEALAESNRNLEQKVQERTQSLSETLEVLKATQAELKFENRLLRSEEDFSEYDYQVGGSLPMNAPTYVVRAADRYLYQALQQGEFCYILNPRQMGKSSLMIQMMHHLRNEGWGCAAVDLTRIGSEEVTLNQWYKGLAVELWKNFGLLRSINLKSWWNEQWELSPVQRFSQFLEEVVLGYVEAEKIVIFIDEVDAVLGLDFSVNDFFGLIRACYNQRRLDETYQRLTFVLLGVATPSDLMSDFQRTPFNIGRQITLNGFKQHEAQPLLEGLADQVKNPQTVLKAVLSWTNGQPFLTQKICCLIRKTSETIPSQQEAQWVAQLVEDRIIHNWEAQDEPEHLRTVRDRVLNASSPRDQILGLYQQILEQGSVTAQETIAEKELLLSGLVEKEDGDLQVKNRIYETIFNQDWVQEKRLKLHY